MSARASQVPQTFETETFSDTQLATYRLGQTYRVWNEAKIKRGALPARADIDILLLKDLLPRLTLYDVIDGGSDFRYRVHATESAAVLKMERTGKLRSEIEQPPARATRMDATLRRVVASGRPLLTRLRSQDGTPPLFVTRLFLPLATDGSAVDMVLVAREPTLGRGDVERYL
jgi:hypothetical protein